ncbi:MAG: PhnD/SsuA/transferrin family substrate-binding protein [Anaerolineae bacterium]|nr:PhnD/SsuA/transferrin family substrate-binding protein [Anaerolineae bacterium]
MIKFTSFLAPNADPVCKAIIDYVAQQLDIQTQFIDNIAYSERWQQFDEGKIEAAWICGLPYVQRVDEQKVKLDLLAAPVMQKPRYKNQPIYYSDIVVHRKSAFYTFDDLKGASWAYNEPGSQSGYNIVRHHLAQLGHTNGYFGQVVQSGGHQASLKMVLDQEIDASAIDSTVLETELILHPEISKNLRIIVRLGPSPIPPWVINKAVTSELREAIQEVMLNMHMHPIGQAILASGQIKRLASVYDGDYNVTRKMAKIAETVTL